MAEKVECKVKGFLFKGCTTPSQEIESNVLRLHQKALDFPLMGAKEKASSLSALHICSATQDREDDKEMPVAFSPSIFSLAAHCGGSDAILCENT